MKKIVLLIFGVFLFANTTIISLNNFKIQFEKYDKEYQSIIKEYGYDSVKLADLSQRVNKTYRDMQPTIKQLENNIQQLSNNIIDEIGDINIANVSLEDLKAPLKADLKYFLDNAQKLISNYYIALVDKNAIRRVIDAIDSIIKAYKNIQSYYDTIKELKKVSQLGNIASQTDESSKNDLSLQQNLEQIVINSVKNVFAIQEITKNDLLQLYNQNFTLQQIGKLTILVLIRELN